MKLSNIQHYLIKSLCLKVEMTLMFLFGVLQFSYEDVFITYAPSLEKTAIWYYEKDNDTNSVL